MPTTQKIQDNLYRNWVRAVLGLCFLQEGLRDFVDRIVKLQHLKTLQDVRKTLNNPTAQCTQCRLDNIYPAHAGSPCILKNGRHCNCRRRGNKHCPFCSQFYDEVIRLHRYSDPCWETDANKWCTDHWQFAKCFLTTTSKLGDKNAVDTDVAGLLSIIINAKFFQKEISSAINAPYDDFSQARLARNEIIHSSTLQLTDTQVARYLQMMIIVLEDAKTLRVDPLAKAAAESIKQIQNEKFVITTESESKAIEVTLAALESMKGECLKEIEKKELESIEAIQVAKDKAVEDITEEMSSTPVHKENSDNIEKLSVDVKNLEKRLTETEEAVASINVDVSGLKEEITDIREKILSLENVQKGHQERLCYLHRKKVLKKHLMEQYEDYLTSDVSPFLPEEDVHLSKVYVPVKMVKTNTADVSAKPVAIDSFHDVVYKDGNLVSNVLVCGGAGTGKTTFCKALICKWCETHSVDKYNDRMALHTIIQGDGSRSAPIADFETMKSFEFLLYVSLRHAYDERFVEDMICNQLFYPDQKPLLMDVLSVEPEVFMILLDGLDEWCPAKGILRPLQTCSFPTTRHKYMKIITSRPWKLDAVRSNSMDVEIRIKLEGIDKTSVDQLTKSTVLELNKKFQSRMFFWKFHDEVRRLKLEELCKTPILLKLLVCLWFDEQSLGKSYCGIYSSVINVMIKHANERYNTDKRFEALKSDMSVTKHCLPTCFDGKDSCQEISALLVSLSRLAFHALFSENRAASLVFQNEDIKKLGLRDEDLELSRKIGLLSVSQVPGCSVINRYQCYSFPHKSLQEFLSAVYISMILSEAEPLNPEIKNGFSSQTTLQQNGAVFKFLCGLDQSKATFLSKFIAHAIDGDTGTSTYRWNLQGQSFLEGYYNSNCHRLVSETQDIYYECIMEGKACGHESMKLYISDLDIDINSKIRTCSRYLDVTSLVTLRIHDERSAVENDFLNNFLQQECASLRDVVLKNVSLTITQLGLILKKTLTLKIDRVDFCDVDDVKADIAICSFGKIKELVISNVKLGCIGMNRLLSCVLSMQSLEKIILGSIDCASLCANQCSNVKNYHVTVPKLPHVKYLVISNVKATSNTLQCFTNLIFALKGLQKLKLKDITCSRNCSYIALQANNIIDFGAPECPLAKEICFDNVPLGQNIFKKTCSIFRTAGSVELRNLTISQAQMDEILTHIADSTVLEKLAISNVHGTLTSSEDENTSDFMLVFPSSQLPDLEWFILSQVHLTDSQMEMILSVLERVSMIKHVSVKEVSCASHNKSEAKCTYDKIKQELFKKTGRRQLHNTTMDFAVSLLRSIQY